MEKLEVDVQPRFTDGTHVIMISTGIYDELELLKFVAKIKDLYITSIGYNQGDLVFYASLGMGGGNQDTLFLQIDEKYMQRNPHIIVQIGASVKDLLNKYNLEHG